MPSLREERYSNRGLGSGRAARLVARLDAMSVAILPGAGVWLRLGAAAGPLK